MSDRYSHLLKEDLIRLLMRRDAERKLGLCWERNTVEHEKALNNDFVALELNMELSHGVQPYDNLLIEGDNFDALRYLQMAYSGRVKMIYIDPPFNTGNDDFIYNDKYVNKEDVFRHSKWLEFMYRRLSLARYLLRNDGVIFVSIGDDEVGYLSVLMDEIFPGRKIGTFVWKRRSGANDPTGYFTSTDHEYILCYANPDFSFQGIEKNLSGYNNYDEGNPIPWKRGDLTKAHTYKARPNSFYPIQNPQNMICYPCNPQRVWGPISERFIKPGKKAPKTTIEKLISQVKVIFPKNDTVVTYETIEELREAIAKGSAPQYLRDNLFDAEKENHDYLNFFVGKQIGYGSPGYKRFRSEVKRMEKPLSTWIVPANAKPEFDASVSVMQSGMTQEGTKLIQQMLGSKAFNYPKPLSLIKNLIQQSTGSDDLILDFFAGSGTTGHAVLALNDEEDTDRRFILVSTSEATLNEPEKNICREVTRTRLIAGITGYSYKTKAAVEKVEGLGGNFAYCTLKRISINHIHSDIQHDQVWYALQQIRGFGISPYRPQEKLQVVETITGQIAYLPEINEAALSAIKKVTAVLTPVTIYSWQPGILRQRIYGTHITLKKIPEFLIDKFGMGK
jgi:adenine-specific DNA-methyltransferase